MRHIYTLTISALLACGPLPPSFETTTSDDTTATTPSATTTAADPTATPTSSTTTDTPVTTTDPSTTGTTGTTDANTFIIPSDLPGNGTIACDNWAQDCPPGQKCVPWSEGGGGAWNATKCVDITGDGAPGDPCTAPEGGAAGIDDCALGSICWNVDAKNHGTCIAQCTGAPDAPICPPKSTCAEAAEAVLAICIPSCHPLLQDCPGTDLCIPNGDSFLCVLDASGDEGQTNDPCEFANNCDKGLVCLNTADASSACDPQSTGCCQPFCKFPDGPCPNPDQQCVQWFDPMMPIPPGYEDLGICAISQ